RCGAAMGPQKARRIGVAAAFASTVRRGDPASAFSPSVMTVMPSRNRPTPPRMEIAVDILAPNLKSFVRSPDQTPAITDRATWLVTAREQTPRAPRPAVFSFRHRSLGTRAPALQRASPWGG